MKAPPCLLLITDYVLVVLGFIESLANTSSFGLNGLRLCISRPPLLSLPTPSSTDSSTSNTMKLILTGCTGFIGGEVLSQCLQNPSVTSIVALSRRKLPDSVGSDGKLKVIVMKDFNAYSEEVVREMEGAGGCIW